MTLKKIRVILFLIYLHLKKSILTYLLILLARIRLKKL